MNNHFHLDDQTPKANLVTRHELVFWAPTRRGSIGDTNCSGICSRPDKALLVDGSGNGYLKRVCDYVHLKPARARLLRAEQALSRWVEQ